MSLNALETLRAGDLPPMRVGRFVPGPSLPPGMDQYVTIRSVTLSSPDDDSFSEYLGNALAADLRAAGRLDPNSGLVISGVLTDSEESDGFSDADGRLAAQFSLQKNGTTVFTKELAVQAHADSSFVGAVAIPAAINNYTSLYDALAVKLFKDSDFIAAAKSSSTAR